MRYPMSKEESRLLEEVGPYFDDNKRKAGEYHALIDDAPAEIKKKHARLLEIFKETKELEDKDFYEMYGFHKI